MTTRWSWRPRLAPLLPLLRGPRPLCRCLLGAARPDPGRRRGAGGPVPLRQRITQVASTPLLLRTPCRPGYQPWASSLLVGRHLALGRWWVSAHASSAEPGWACLARQRLSGVFLRCRAPIQELLLGLLWLQLLRVENSAVAVLAHRHPLNARPGGPGGERPARCLAQPPPSRPSKRGRPAGAAPAHRPGTAALPARAFSYGGSRLDAPLRKCTCSGCSARWLGNGMRLKPQSVAIHELLDRPLCCCRR